MASAPGVNFSSALATAVVEAAWTRMDCTPYTGQTRPAPTLALVTALLVARDEDPALSFVRPSENDLAERNGGDSDAATVATAGSQPWGVAVEMVGVVTTTTVAGVTAVVEVGKVQRVLVWLRAPPRGHFWFNNEGSGHSSGGGMARGERSTWGGSSTSFRSFSFSKMDDHSEVDVVADKRCQEPWQEEHLGLTQFLERPSAASTPAAAATIDSRSYFRRGFRIFRVP